MATNHHAHVQQQNAIVHICVGQGSRVHYAGLFGFRPPQQSSGAEPVTETQGRLLIAKACLEAFGEMNPRWQSRTLTVIYATEFESEAQAQAFAQWWEEDLEEGPLQCEVDGRKVLLSRQGQLNEMFILKALLLGCCVAIIFGGELVAWGLEEAGQHWMAVSKPDTGAAKTLH